MKEELPNSNHKPHNSESSSFQEMTLDESNEAQLLLALHMGFTEERIVEWIEAYSAPFRMLLNEDPGVVSLYRTNTQEFLQVMSKRLESSLH